MKKSIIVIIIALVIIVGAILTYFIFFNKSIYPSRGNFNPRNFQLNETEINKVKDFFNSNPSSEQVNEYCSQNRRNCFYYCRNIDTTNPYCKTMMNMTRPRNMTYRGNYSGNRGPGGNMPPPGAP